MACQLSRGAIQHRNPRAPNAVHTASATVLSFSSLAEWLMKTVHSGWRARGTVTGRPHTGQWQPD
jgi:hypothetical protein